MDVLNVQVGEVVHSACAVLTQKMAYAGICSSSTELLKICPLDFASQP
jgi:hypothetical protein